MKAGKNCKRNTEKLPDSITAVQIKVGGALKSRNSKTPPQEKSSQKGEREKDWKKRKLYRIWLCFAKGRRKKGRKSRKQYRDV